MQDICMFCADAAEDKVSVAVELLTNQSADNDGAVLAVGLQRRRLYIDVIVQEPA